MKDSITSSSSSCQCVVDVDLKLNDVHKKIRPFLYMYVFELKEAKKQRGRIMMSGSLKILGLPE